MAMELQLRTHIANNVIQSMSDKPKRGPLTAFNHFFKFEHKKLSANGILSGSQMVKEISIKWKSLNERERKPYLDAAFIEQKRYRTALAKWKAENKRKKDNDTVCNVSDTFVSGNQPTSSCNTYCLRDESNADLFRRLMESQHEMIKLHHKMMPAVMHSSTVLRSFELSPRVIPSIEVERKRTFFNECSTAPHVLSPLGQHIPSPCQPNDLYSPFPSLNPTFTDDNWTDSVAARSARLFDASDDADNPVQLSELALLKQDCLKACTTSEMSLQFVPRKNGFEHDNITFPCLSHDAERRVVACDYRPSHHHFNISKFVESPIVDEASPRFHEVAGVFDFDPERNPIATIHQTKTVDPVRVHHSWNARGNVPPEPLFPEPDFEEMQELLRVFEDRPS